MSMPFDTDTLIIGASAAGLATATCLKQAKLSFEILEGTDLVGDTWLHHYDRLPPPHPEVQLDPSRSQDAAPVASLPGT